MIHYFPLEPSETRYTGYYDRTITSTLHVPYRRYYPSMEGRELSRPPIGMFISPAASLEFRSRQIGDFANALFHGQVESGDLLFFTDLLMPGAEAIAWTAQVSDMKLRIRGLVHGGSFNAHDIMAPAERWAAPLETSILDLAEEVYLGSEFSKQEIVKARLVDPDKLIVTGHLLDPALGSVSVPDRKEPLVVFTSRISTDKQPWLFRRLAHDLHGSGQFVVALQNDLSKPEYYDLLARARVVVSYALHETFGIGVMEAVTLGCVPVVPDRLCYVEQYPRAYRFRDYEESLALVQQALDGDLDPPVAPFSPEPGPTIERWFQ